MVLGLYLVGLLALSPLTSVLGQEGKENKDATSYVWDLQKEIQKGNLAKVQALVKEHKIDLTKEMPWTGFNGTSNVKGIFNRRDVSPRDLISQTTLGYGVLSRNEKMLSYLVEEWNAKLGKDQTKGWLTTIRLQLAKELDEYAERRLQLRRNIADGEREGLNKDILNRWNDDLKLALYNYNIIEPLYTFLRDFMRDRMSARGIVPDAEPLARAAEPYGERRIVRRGYSHEAVSTPKTKRPLDL